MKKQFNYNKDDIALVYKFLLKEKCTTNELLENWTKFSEISINSLDIIDMSLIIPKFIHIVANHKVEKNVQ